MKDQNGFTIIEVLVTVTISAVFLITIYTLYQAVLNLSIEANRQTIASNIAYNNLRKYANGTKPRWFNCQPVPSDRYILEQTTQAIDGLPEPVLQTTFASAPYGCNTSIKIESEITYGSNNKKVSHAIYAAF